MTVIVGLVGCGRWGRLILRDLVLLDAVVHVAVRDLDDREELLALGASSVVVGCDSLPTVDPVVVATPTSAHAESIERVLPRGVPVFVEKPLTDDPRASRWSTNRAPERVFVMDKWRYHAGVHVFRDLKLEGSPREPSARRSARSGCRTGLHHTDIDCSWMLLPHDLSIAREVVGAYPKPVRAIGRTVDRVLRHIDATLCIDPDVAMRASFGIDTAKSKRRVAVIGTAATAVLAGGWEEVVTVYPSGGGATRERLPSWGSFRCAAELRAFVGHLSGGPAPVSCAVDAARAVEIVSEVRSLAGIEA